MKTERIIEVRVRIEGVKTDVADTIVRDVHKRVSETARFALIAASKRTQDMEFNLQVAGGAQ